MKKFEIKEEELLLDVYKLPYVTCEVIVSRLLVTLLQGWM